MELGIIGLGRMGANMSRRLIRAGHRIVVHDLNAAAVDRAVAHGAAGTPSVESLVKQLKRPRAIWLMVPAGEAVESTVDSLMPWIESNDVIIDGGNSYYKDTMRRAAAMAPKGIEFIDAGTSGGIWGLQEGYCLMIGGAASTVERLRPI